MRLIRIVIPSLLLGACMFGTSKEAKFYTQAAISTQALDAAYKSSVGVNRVQLPKYMDRPQMVTQQKDTIQMSISEFNRWVESPAILSTRAVTDNLSVLLPTALVKINKANGDKFDRMVVIEVIHLNAILGDKAELVAWYTVKDGGKKTLIQQKFTATVQIGKTYDDMANGYNQLWAQLSQEIAEKLVSNK